MPDSRCVALLAVVVTLSTPAAAWAAAGSPPQAGGAQTSPGIDRAVTPDQVITLDGSTLQGTIHGMQGGRLTLTNEFSDSVRIDQDKIVAVLTLTPLDVVLYDGRRLRGTLATDGSGAVIITPMEGGSIETVRWADIDELWELPPHWDGGLLFGFSENSGNSQALSGSLRLDATRTGQHHRIKANATGSFNKAFGEAAVQKAGGSLAYDHYLRTRLYACVTGDLLHDIGQDLTIRSASHVGLGYDLIDRPASLLSVELGVGVLVNRYEVDVAANDTDLSARAELWTDIPFGHGITLSDSLVLFLHSAAHLDNTLDLEIELSSDWTLTLTSNLQVSSEPSILADEWDHQTVLAIGYSF